MEITDIQIRLMDEERLKAFVTIIIDDCFAIRSCRVIDSGDRLFVAMPSRMVNGEHLDVAHPITSEARRYIEDSVLSAYRERLSTRTSGRRVAIG